jgi:hypothetical protein
MAYIEYKPTTLLDDQWQWGQTLNLTIKQWVLGYAGKPDVIYASVILTSGPYHIIVRDKDGLISLDDRAADLDVAMIAAETSVLFVMKELIGENKA